MTNPSIRAAFELEYKNVLDLDRAPPIDGDYVMVNTQKRWEIFEKGYQAATSAVMQENAVGVLVRMDFESVLPEITFCVQPETRWTMGKYALIALPTPPSETNGEK